VIFNQKRGRKMDQYETAAEALSVIGGDPVLTWEERKRRLCQAIANCSSEANVEEVLGWFGGSLESE
jgi:hypothetical protein